MNLLAHHGIILINSSSLAQTLPFKTLYFINIFYMGLSKDSRESLNAASRRAFLHLSTSEARAMLDRISGKTPCISIPNELSEKNKKSSPEQEDEVLVAKSQSLRSQDLAINTEPPIP
jgi:hypothetical protein